MKRIIFIIMAMGLHVHSWADPWITFSGSGSFDPERKADERRISFANGIVFDTRDGEPALPLQFRAVPDNDGAKGAYLVQFAGPIRREWISALSATGAHIISYYPSYCYLVRMDESVCIRVKNLPCVVWTGPFHPAYKVVQSSLFMSRGSGGLVLLLFPDADIDEAARAVERLGGTGIERHVSRYAKTITIGSIDDSRIPALAALPQVMALHTRDKTTLSNTDAQWVLQSGFHPGMARPDATDVAARPMWRRGLTGKGIIVGYHDTGINFNIGTSPNNGHILFRDPAVPITKEGEYPNHRKVVAYRVYPKAAFGDVDMMKQFHGTHTGGSIAGNDTIANGTGPDTVDGIAKDARLCFVDICDEKAEITVPDDITEFTDLVMKSSPAGEIRQHSGSWGSYTDEKVCDYRTIDATHDAWHWDHKLVLAIYAVGNHGLQSRTVHHPAVAKNVLSVGSCLNGLNAFKSMRASSRGPTQDNRIKPTIIGPGWEIRSARGATVDQYIKFSGTSMATPLVNGAMALIRQYFEEGWYPLGKPRPQNAFQPSSALMRAMAVCSADSGLELDIKPDAKYMPPDSNIGFGRLTLDSVLYFDTLGTGKKNLAVVDYRDGVATGKYVEFAVQVKEKTFPLRVVLAWTDTAASVGANPSLVNDLNLELIAPGGTTYRGNQLSNWRSVPDPQKWDDRNVEEMIRVVNPDAGIWKIRVRGQNMPNGGHVWFGLAATGSLGTVQTGNGNGVFGAPRLSNRDFGTVVSGLASGSVRIRCSIRTPGIVRLTIYTCAGKLVRSLANEHGSAGEKIIVWDGRDTEGTKAPCGFYLYEIKPGK